MSKGKILVTGGTGYIGSHTVVELQQSGFEVVIIDDLSNSSVSTLDSIEKITGIRPQFEEFNLQDYTKCDAFFTKYEGIKAIIHFAAYKAVGESVQEPLKYYQNNLLSLMNLVNCQRKFGVENIVFSSSCTVYGQPEVLPVTEATPRKEAESPYGNTKSVCEDILRDSTSAYENINALALRYFNPIGAHESGLIGENPSGVPDNLVPFITQTAAGIREQLSVFGDDYDTRDGSCVRDFINVVDLAKAHVIAIDRLLTGKSKASYEFFNIGTGDGATVLELINSFMEATGVDLNYKIVARRDGDIEKIYADTTLANEELGWKAEKSLGETLASAWNWEKNYRGL